MLNELKGMVMEIEDGAYPLIESVIATTDPTIAFSNVDYAILIGELSNNMGIEDKDWPSKNTQTFKRMGEELQDFAKETCKVLVVANPANTLCLMCSRYAPKIPKRNFAALTRLDQNRATFQLAHKLKVPIRAVSNVVIWGNHSSTQVLDVSHAVVTTDGVKTHPEIEEKWVRNEFTQCVRQRDKAVFQARNFASTTATANAIKDCIRDWHFGTPEGEYVALAVYSNGSYYGLAKDIFYSLPVRCNNGTYSVVSDLKVSEDVRKMMKKSEEELLTERHEAGLDK